MPEDKCPKCGAATFMVYDVDNHDYKCDSGYCHHVGFVQSEKCHIVELTAENAAMKSDIANAVKCAKEYEPDYIFILNTASEAVWACGEGGKGASLACTDLHNEINRLKDVIDRIDMTLRVPAAEYVPAIGDVFTIIDKAGLRRTP